LGRAVVQSVSVKYFPQFVARKKRSIDEADESSSGVGFDVLVVWWVEPFYTSSPFRCVGGLCSGGLNSSLGVYPLFLNAS